MRFRRLYLTRFGHFTDHVIDFGPKPDEGQPDFHVIYGLNEAGKTTLLNAVARLLFRFPRQDAEAYDFAHGADLEVGADIEDLPGRSDMRVRRIKVGNALLDDHGDRLPDDFFAGALAGLGEDEYRMVFSIDRQSVIDGAEDIKKAGGEAGRLLFAAHAGLTNLTATLDAGEKAAQEIFVSGGKKQRVPQIKHRLKEIATEIRDRDVTAAKYEKLRRDERKAARLRDDWDKRVRDCKAEIRQVDAQIRIRDLGASLRALRDQLGTEFVGYPDWTNEPHEKTLSQLNGELSSAVSTIEERRKDIEALKEERDGIEIDDAVIAIEDRLEAVEELRSGANGALQHYAKRRGRASELGAEMIRRLATASGAAVEVLREELVLEYEAIDALQGTERGLEEAENALATARDELTKAETKAESLKDELKEGLQELPLVEAVAERLAILGLEEVAEAAKAARDEIERRRQTAAEALSKLAVAGRTFSEVPETELTALSVREDATLFTKRMGEANTAEKRVSQLEEDIHGCEAALDDLEKGIGVEAIDIEESRAPRDAAWRAHRAAFDDATADNFEREMLRHDEVEDVRFDRASDVGQAMAMRRQLNETRKQLENAKLATEKANKAVRASEEAHAAALRAPGLPDRMTRVELADWLDLAETARQETRRLEQEREGRRTDLERQATVGREIRDLLPDLDGLEDARAIAVATERLEVHRETARLRAGALRQIERMQKDVDQRRRYEHEAEEALKTSQTLWDETVTRWLPDDHGLTDVRAALPALADVSRTGRDWREIVDRANKLRRDAETFIDEICRLALELGVSIEAFAPPASREETDASFVQRIEAAMKCERTLQMRLRAAREAGSRCSAIKDQVAEMEEKINEAKEEREVAEVTIGLFRSRFPETIDVGEIAALEAAVGRAREATRLRADALQKERDLCAVVGETENADPFEYAQALAETDLEGERGRLEDALEMAEEERNQTAEAYGGAKHQLDSVTGADEVARLEAERAALEEDLLSCVLEHARRCMGSFLARRAIDDYRREHRSEMMQAASEAFARLTQGRYVGLTSRSDGGRDVLVASSTEDDATRRAEDMSAGTRMQLYFALRVAAYQGRIRGLPACPFIADDVFESFDDYRTQAACEQMLELGFSGQSIYLTHHSDVSVRASKVCSDRDVVQFLPGVPEEDMTRINPVA